MFKILWMIPFLVGCQLYGGLAIHDRSFDSEHKEDNLIAVVGASQDLTQNLEVYFEHKSLPNYKETGYGSNLVGLNLKAKIY